MKDYINRKDLETEILGLTIVSPDVVTYAEAVLDRVKSAPSVERGPGKHGHWEEQIIWICNSDGEPVAAVGTEYKCSRCGRTEDEKEPYCHCGAKMDSLSEDYPELDNVIRQMGEALDRVKNVTWADTSDYGTDFYDVIQAALESGIRALTEEELPWT